MRGYKPKDTVFKAYYYITKPGIIYGNILTATAGYLFACKWHVVLIVFTALIAGTSLVIASACVYNNYIDQGIDKKMARTKQRALVSGSISGRNALLYATALGIIGATLLVAFTNWLTVAVGVVAFIDYVVLYGISKRRSVHGTLVGSVSGAAPIVAGYTAVTNRLDLTALLLFLIMVFWQMPHFYAIAMYRLSDYQAAHIPVLPSIKGMRHTKVQIIAYIVAFIAAITALTVWGYTGSIFLAVMLVVSAVWLYKGLSGFKTSKGDMWGRSMFLFSLIVIMVLSVALSFGSILA